MNTNKLTSKYIRSFCYVMTLFEKVITSDPNKINDNIDNGKMNIVQISRIINFYHL